MLQREVEDLHSAVDHEGKGKQSAEKLCKQIEIQLTESQAKSDEQARTLSDYSSLKSRLQGEAADLSRQLEDAESQINALNRIKQQMNSQQEELKRQLEDETREKHGVKSQVLSFERFILYATQVTETDFSLETTSMNVINSANNWMRKESPSRNSSDFSPSLTLKLSSGGPNMRARA